MLNKLSTADLIGGWVTKLIESIGPMPSLLERY